MRRALAGLSSTRLGLALIAAYALFAAMGSLPFFDGPDGSRLALRHLAWIDRSEGEYFSWWPGVGLLIGLVVNMTLSMVLRVPRTWSKAPVLLTHGGVLLLALGASLYAAQKQEGELLLLAPEMGAEAGPSVREFLDRTRVGVSIALDTGEVISAAEVLGLPRFHAAGSADAPALRLPAGSGAGASGSAWAAWVTGFDPGPVSPAPDSRDGSSVAVHVQAPAGAGASALSVPFSRHAPALVPLGDGSLGLRVGYGPLRRPMPGVSVALRGVDIDLVPGSEVERSVRAVLRTADGEDHAVSLNEPFTVAGIEPPACDCVVRGAIERLWTRWINPVRWKFSIAGWDHDGWLTSREAAIAGITDRPRAGFVVLGVGTLPGVRIVAAGAVMLSLGAAWALIASARRRRGAVAAAAVLVAFAIPSRAGAAEVSDISPVAPLRTLPVQWNGRIAPLDTVARDIVRAVSGLDRVPGVDGRPEDPLVTIVSMMCDPEAAADRPLIAAGAFPAVGGASLLSINGAQAAIRAEAGRVQSGSTDRVRHAAVRQIAERLGVLRLASGGLALAAPDPNAGEFERADWMTLDDLRAPPMLRAAFEDFAQAWRSGESTAAYASASRWASLMRAHNTGKFEPSRVWGEALVNSVGVLRGASWLYAAAAMLLIVAVGLGWDRAGAIGGWAYMAAFAVHTAGFCCRWWIAGRLPIQNQFESVLGLSMGACLAAGAWGALARGPDRSAVVLAAGATVGFGALAVAHHTPVPGFSIEPEAAILGTAALLKYHVATVLLAYGLIALGGALGVLHLLAGWSGRAVTVRASIEPALRPLLKLAFWTLGIGILLGALWADRSWGRWWAFDPKETWALITWLVYLFAVHLNAGGRQPAPAKSLAWAHIVGSLVMIWTWFGVNLLLPGLHAYAGS